MQLCSKCGFELDGVLCGVYCRKTRKPRVWSPKCRAVTFKDKRTKRQRTRSEQKRQAIREQL